MHDISTTEEFPRLAEENRQDQYIVEVGGDERRYTVDMADHNLDYCFFPKIAVGFFRSLYLRSDVIRFNRFERENPTTYPDGETVSRATDRSILVRDGKRKRGRSPLRGRHQ
jgi:hypothetical protein